MPSWGSIQGKAPPSHLLTPDLLHGYQLRAIHHIIEHPFSMLWLGLGLGKSIITLSAFVQLQDQLKTGSMLAIGPLRVVQSVWRQEAQKWSHTRHLRFSLIHGKPEDRLRAMMVPADIYLINYEGVHWLVRMLWERYLSKGKYPPFRMIAYDEVTRVKNSEARVSEHLKVILPWIDRRVGLTGTPAANGYADLFGQYLAVDQGARLGQSIGSYRAAFLTFSGFGHAGKYTIRDREAMDAIHECIADITMEMSARDYLDLPEIIVNDIELELEPKDQALYDQMEQDMFVQLDNEAKTVIEVFHVLAKNIKLRQLANGAAFVQPDDPRWEWIHDKKLEALEEIVEEAGGRPVLVAHQFKHDAARIKKRWKDTQFINSKLGERKIQQLVNDWNADKIPLLSGHPKSMAHGLNLQYGSCQDIVLFGLDWSPEMMEQVVGRLMRQGQRNNIRVHRLLMRNTVDELMRDVLAMKEMTEADMKLAVNAYRKLRGL